MPFSNMIKLASIHVEFNVNRVFFSFRYVVSYENPGNIIRLTEPGVSHTIEMDEVCIFRLAIRECQL